MKCSIIKVRELTIDIDTTIYIYMKLTICSEDVAVEMNSAFCFMKTTPHGHDVL
jgi:hypothetical protein